MKPTKANLKKWAALHRAYAEAQINAGRSQAYLAAMEDARELESYIDMPYPEREKCWMYGIGA